MATLLVAATVVVGAGFVPAKRALATVDVPLAGSAGQLVLAPVEEPQKTEELRQPSGLGVADAGAACVLKPTRSRRAVWTARPAAAETAVVSSEGWQQARVSWYGPGFIGNTMAGGGALQWDSMVVAHRSMAFGTRIEFSYNGRTCIAVVMDRGPYTGGRTFDLGPGTAAALGFSGVGTVEYRILY